MNFSTDEIAALEADTQNIGVFFRLDTNPVVRMWLGFFDIAPGVNVMDPSGATYAGFGEIRNIPTFKQLLNGAAERVEFTLSGVSGDLLAIASGGDAQQVKGKSVAVGFALFAPDWSLLGPIHWTAHYIADFLAVDQQPADVSNSIIRTITLSCGSRFTGRRRPAYSYLSDQDQQARFPGDLFCRHTIDYAHGFNKTWPVF